MLRTGRTRAGPLVAVYWLLREEDAGPRVALVASRRTGSAVVRNRIRRRLAAALQRRLDQLSPHADLVIVARRRAAVASFAALERDLVGLLRAAGLLSEPDNRDAGMAQEDEP